MATLTMEGEARRITPMTRCEVDEIHRRAKDGAAPSAIALAVCRSENTVRRALAVRPEDWPSVSLRSAPPPPSASIGTRRRRAQVRADMVAGRLTLQDVLVPPHPAVAELPLVDVVRLQWSAAGRRATPALEELGKSALRDRVNLMMAAGRASGYSRAWVAEHGSKWARPRAVAS